MTTWRGVRLFTRSAERRAHSEGEAGGREVRNHRNDVMIRTDKNVIYLMLPLVNDLATRGQCSGVGAAHQEVGQNLEVYERWICDL
jgi:hypothetical protein